MDPLWVAKANEAVDWSLQQPNDSPHAFGGDEQLPQRHGPACGPLALPHPHCAPFRKMIAHPLILQKLEWILGAGFVHYGESSQPGLSQGLG
jgi:hypothetical protein